MWEALLNHWQNDPAMAHVRDLLAQTLCEMSVAISMVVDPEDTKLVWELPRPALQCTMTLPVGQHERGLFGLMVYNHDYPCWLLLRRRDTAVS